MNDGFYTIIPLNLLRTTKNVLFHSVPLFEKLDAIDRVRHGPNAVSPGPVGNVQKPWYIHFDQDDNLLVFKGLRLVDLYSPKEKKVVTFEITPEKILMQGKLLFDGPAIFGWPKGVFHRVRSGPEGSLSMNFAVHYSGFDLKHNFDIVELNEETGKYKVIRDGHLDQP